MLLTGLAVDTARYQDLSTRMQQALDGASLAAAKLLSDESLSDSDIQDRANAYFQAAIPTFGIKPSSISPLVVAIDRAKSSVEVAGGLQVPAFFGGFADLPTLTVLNQKSKVVYDMQAVELSMVLDITGSMKSNNKLGDLKVAAKDVIDTLFDGAISDDNVRIAVAPYSASVNAGALASKVSAVPATTTCTMTWFGQKCTASAGVDADTCVIERTGPNAATDATPTGASLLSNMSSPAYGNYLCPTANVVPLQNRTQRDNLKAIIDGYSADGATAGHIGTAWGWYLLSPNWASVLPPESEPLDYGQSGVQKNMIIMTDGEFNTSYISGAPAVDQTTQTDESYLQFDSLCANIKDKGITIYTVGFDLNDANALAHLGSCASSADSFYDVKTGNQLKDAFKAIADRLGNLRVAS
jgi:Flp pilus assembly protein TadG